jgi:hypothetical protein
LMRTAVPALTWFSGHNSGWGQPGGEQAGGKSFTDRRLGKLRLSCKRDCAELSGVNSHGSAPTRHRAVLRGLRGFLRLDSLFRSPYPRQ